MLQSLSNVHGFKLHARDGELGTADDVYFDDAHWMVRYLVVDTGKWLPGRLVLIAPPSVTGLNWTGRTISVDLTCDQVRNSPDASDDKPVSRQHEQALSVYYGWPPYWADPAGFEPFPLPVPQMVTGGTVPEGDPHLRSARAIKGYHIAALDGPIGRMSDFVFDDTTWQISFLMVNTGSWLHERLVLIKPDWTKAISWDDREVAVGLTREAVRTSPHFVEGFPMDPDYAVQLLKHYQEGPRV